MPIRIASGGLMVAIRESSLMPHTSQIGSPRALKNSSTSGAIGAAPETR